MSTETIFTSNERLELFETAQGLNRTTVEFITTQHIVTGEWPNGFALCERHSRGMALLGALAGLKISAISLDVGDSTVIQGSAVLRDALKDYLCGLGVMLAKFPILYRMPTEDEDDEE